MDLLSGISHNKVHLIPLQLKFEHAHCIGFMNLWIQDHKTRLTIQRHQYSKAKIPWNHSYAGIYLLPSPKLFNTDPFIITPGVKCNIIQPSIVDCYIVDPSKLPYQRRRERNIRFTTVKYQ